MHKCLYCGCDFGGRKKKYCSEDCGRRHWHARNKTSDKVFPSRKDGGCAECGASLEGRTKQTRYCSSACKSAARNRGWRERHRASQPLVECANPYCGQTFTQSHRRMFCSKKCLRIGQSIDRGRHAEAQAYAIKWGMLEACRVYLHSCRDCGVILVRRNRNGNHARCGECRRLQIKRWDATKSAKRRGMTTPITMNVYDLAARDGTLCHICRKRVDMALSGMAKQGPTIEHITPVSLGGTNDPSNLALAHRHCNTSRGNRGHSQLLLIA
jgi:endogenous inhibitor of DNA gyrase (YacG/DUF329 family)